MAAISKPKHLESRLQELEDVASPLLELEQYTTPPHIAAYLLWEVQAQYNDILDKVVLDLGCGNGILGIGCLLLGAKSVLAVDIDEASLEVAKQNASYCELSSEQMCFLQQDVRLLDTRGMKFSTAVINPPFGTRGQAGIDVVFVQKALEVSSVVYSMHKTSTRTFWKQKGEQWNVGMKPMTQVTFNLDCSYKFHKRKSHDINIDLLRFWHT